MITRGVGGLYTVVTADGEEILCRARGVLRREQITPTVGDDVYVSAATEADICDSIEAENSADCVGRSSKHDAAPVYRQKHARHGKKSEVNITHVIDEVFSRKNLLIRPPVSNLD
ncbi:MAG: hypothetical protein IJC62_00825, partial [Clostridia bacterium]|nr:hypothetical protein [Clostridia bacterium]